MYSLKPEIFQNLYDFDLFALGRTGTFDFTVGTGSVIKGWDVGIMTMKKGFRFNSSVSWFDQFLLNIAQIWTPLTGELCILRCRADYAYGDRGSPPKIPGGASLDFEV